eukprot:gene7121-11284_t
MSKEEKPITRQNWKSHPYYHGSASFLISIHDSFRSSFKEISKLIEQKNFEKAKKMYDNLNEHLDNHHYIEEARMFPNLKKKMKKLKLEENANLIDGLTSDHKEMSIMMDELERLFKQKKYEEIPELWIKFKKHMLKHLIEEEDISIPIIIQYGVEI